MKTLSLQCIQVKNKIKFKNPWLFRQGGSNGDGKWLDFTALTWRIPPDGGILGAEERSLPAARVQETEEAPSEGPASEAFGIWVFE
jgi:hypothetical protein